MCPHRLRMKSALRSRLFRPNLRSNPAGMSFVQAHYHPFLFTMMLLSGTAELGLTAFLVNAGNTNGTWPSPRYHALLLFILFNATWTVLFATAYMLWLLDSAKHVLANIASSIFWLSATVVLWVNPFVRSNILLQLNSLQGVSAGIFHSTRTGGRCPTSPPISRCRQSLTVEALAWTEFAISAVALFFTCIWAGRTSGRRSVRDSRRMV
ncbi:hypothetical protein B0H15DRAFT_216576 [Mycena belliarum]|uniref:MARVEL domain-containing protein n=1 Tax=Mycena belliarum TaxID=1033014 RepID=A0AAD6XUF3_9AGAR|nr:hypothetical protein B0H15DRAFT_216576 [Mycena belliae]